MVDLAEKLMYVTVQVRCELEGGGLSQGTGFIFTYSKGNRSLPVLITNKHVVCGASKTRLAILTFIPRTVSTRGDRSASPLMVAKRSGSSTRMTLSTYALFRSKAFSTLCCGTILKRTMLRSTKASSVAGAA
ncbi:MAG: hypothetical protein ACLS3M_02085 [Collinsella sp.]